MRKNPIILFAVIVFASCQQQVSLDYAVKVYQQAAGKYQALLDKNPSDQKLKFQLALFYYKLGNFNLSRQTAQGLDSLAGKVLLAKSLAQLQEYGQALELFTQLGEINDNEYLFLYAQALEKKNSFPQAKKIYQKVFGKYQTQAKQRLEQIGLSFQTGIPEEIKNILQGQKGFLDQLTEDEAVALFSHQTIEIKPDNTAVSSIHSAIKILNEKGKNFGEVQISYDSSDERVELEYARTITTDGTVVYAGKENIRDVSKYLNFPLYSNAHVFIISMPAVSVGAIIEYKLKVFSSKLIARDNFSFSYQLRESIPMVSADFDLIVPKNKTALIKILNSEFADEMDFKPKIETDSQVKKYNWKFFETDPIIPEDRMAQVSLINPAILISSFSDWQEIYQWWKPLYQDKLVLTEEMREFLNKLIAGCKTDWQKANKIYQFCSRQVRYVAVEYGESGYEPHQAKDIFWNRYGDCKDKAILSVAMMQAAGLKAYPVLIATRQEYLTQKDFPCVLFNHAIAAVMIDSKLVFFDPTAMTASFGDLPLDDQKRLVVVFKENNYSLEITPELSDNGIDYFTKINLDDQGNADISREVTAKGFFAAFQRYYFEYTHPKKLKEDVQQRMAQISPVSSLIDFGIENADDLDAIPKLKYKFKAQKFINNQLKSINLNLPDDISFDQAYIGKTNRVYPLEFDGLFTNSSRIEVFLPKEYAVSYLPETIKIQNQWFEFAAQYQQQDNKIICEKKFSVIQRFVSVADYPEFKRQGESLLQALDEKITLSSMKKTQS